MRQVVRWPIGPGNLSVDTQMSSYGPVRHQAPSLSHHRKQPVRAGGELARPVVLRRWLTSTDSPTSAHEREKEDPEPIDWGELEDLLVCLSTGTVKRFAADHPDEVFYGLGFDCHADYGQVLVCLNTREAQREAEDEDDAWAFGNWRYHGINLEDSSWEAWEEAALLVSNAANVLLNNRKGQALPALYETFLEMATRALLRVARSDAVGRLRKESGLQVLAMDHDEGPEAGFTRMERLRPTTP